jgi:serine/threonine protein kinase
MLAQQLHVRAPTPRLINPSISPALEASLLQALRKDPQERFTSAEEMAHALQVAAEAPAQPAGQSEIGAASETSERPRRRLRWLMGAGKRSLPFEQRTPVSAFSLR